METKLKCNYCGKTIHRPKSHIHKTNFCSRECHHNFQGKKPVVKCDYCGKDVKIKKTNKDRRHFCDRNCYYRARSEEITLKKDWIIAEYHKGRMLKEIAEELHVTRGRIYLYAKKWNLPRRRTQNYPELMKQIGLKKTEVAKANFMRLYQEGKLSWRTAHKWASKIWKITDSPCQVCGWKEAERDMHLKIPRLLEKSNAISLCPNCHRLVHRGKITL